MKTLVLVLTAFAAAGAQDWRPVVSNARFETRAFSGSGDLASQIRAGSASWFGYSVKTVPGDGSNCCWNGGGPCGWRLEGERPAIVSGTASPSGPVHLEGSRAAAILFRVESNAVQKIEIYSADCPLDAGGLPFVWITGVTAKASLAYLQTFISANGADHTWESAILAISMHDDAQADGILEQLARPAEAKKIREKAIFWMGVNRGARGVAVLKKILESDASDQIRDKAVFALSISKQVDALDPIIRAAHNDSSPHVRSQALFWLAQKSGERAVATISNAIENDPDTEVKKKAVFGLSQLPRDQAIPKLIEIARTQRNPQVRKQAFFWLGQSGDPRALAFIEQTLLQ
jgi:HEAT repeats